MDPLTTHVTCRIRIYEESVNRLAAVLTGTGDPVPGTGPAGTLYCEKNLVLAPLACMDPDDPGYPGLVRESGRVSGRLAEIEREHGTRLRDIIRGELKECVDRYYSMACWGSAGVTVEGRFPLRERIGALTEALGEDPTLREQNRLVADIDRQLEEMDGSEPVPATIPCCQRDMDASHVPRKIREE